MRPRTRRLLSLAAVTTATALGAVAGWRIERRLLRGTGQNDDPEWAVLRERVLADSQRVRAGDGTELHVEVTEPPGEPHGTIVFTHGYGMSLHTWHYQRLALVDRYRTVAFDHRGHGRSGGAGADGYTIDALGRDLAAVLEATVPEGERTLVVGHSMGGMAVLSYAWQHQHRVRQRLAGAVLIDTSGSDVLAGTVFSTGVTALSAIELRLADRVFDTYARASRFVDRAYATSTDLSHLLTRAVALNRHASPAHVAFVEQMFLECSNEVKAALAPAVTAVNLRDAAPVLRVPTVVVVGTADRLTPPSSARKLVRALPDARLVELDGVGHTAPLEAHRTVTATIAELAGQVWAPPAAREVG